MYHGFAFYLFKYHIYNPHLLLHLNNYLMRLELNYGFIKQFDTFNIIFANTNVNTMCVFYLRKCKQVIPILLIAELWSTTTDVHLFHVDKYMYYMLWCLVP